MKHEASDDGFLSSRSNFQQIMSKSLGDFTNNVKIKKRKREMVSDSDSDVSRNSSKRNKLNGCEAQYTIKREIISDLEGNDDIGTVKKRKKSKSRTNGEGICESNMEESVKRKKNGETFLMKKSLSDVEDNNTFGEERKSKKSKKHITEQFNGTTGELFEEPVKKKSKKRNTVRDDCIEDDKSFGKMKKSKKRTDNEEIMVNEGFEDDSKQKMEIINENSVNGVDEEVEAYLKKINCTGALSKNINKESTENNHQEFYREQLSSQRRSIKPPSAEYIRDVTEILNDFENKNESLKKVCCEDSNVSSLNSNSAVFIVQIPINLNLKDLIGQEISVVKKKKIKTDDGKYITTSLDEVEPVMLMENNQCMRLHPTHVVTFEKHCKIDDSETFNVSDFVNNLNVNIIDPATLTKKNPIIGLEKEEYEKVLNSSVEEKLKASEKQYKKYKNKKIKKSLPTESGIKQNVIKDEEIFKYLSQPS